MTSIFDRIVRFVRRADFKSRRKHELAILAVSQETDDEDNHDSTPPDDECIELKCLWAVEFFTPAHLDSLAENLRRFNRDYPSDAIENERVDAWIKGLHRSPLRGSWTNLGVWEPKESSHRFGSLGRKVDLPESVACATASISHASRPHCFV